MAPPYSPPRHRPWMIRRPKRMNAAVRPICSYVGINPIAPVPSPIPLSVTRNVYLRPTRSPIHPKRNAPSGRIRNPAVNSAIVLSRAATGLDCSKNLTDRTAARLPKIEVIPFDDVSHRRSDNHAAEIPRDLNCHVWLLLFQGIAHPFFNALFSRGAKSIPTFTGATTVDASATPEPQGSF